MNTGRVSCPVSFYRLPVVRIAYCPLLNKSHLCSLNRTLSVTSSMIVKSSARATFGDTDVIHSYTIVLLRPDHSTPEFK